jgi:uncharacterized protein (TIRG00374 family)
VTEHGSEQTERRLPATRGSSWLSRHGLKLAGSLLIAAGFAYVLHRGALPIVPDADAFSKMRWWTLPAYLALWSVVHLVRAARWYLLLVPVSEVRLRRVLAVAFIGFAAVVLLPFRTGEVVRPVLIREKGKLSGWAATGTVGAERVLDGLFLSVLLFITLRLSKPLDPLPDRIGNLPVPAAVVPGAAYAALALFAAAFAVMVVFYFARDAARRATLRTIGFFSASLARWLADRVEKVADGLRFLPRLRYTLPFLAATVCYWLLNAAGAWLLAWGCGFDDISYVEACVIMGVLALGILVPNAPGFFGAFQISLYAGFAMFFSAELVVGPGAAFVFLLYLSQLVVTFGAAGLSALAEHTDLREALAADAKELA